MKTLINGQAEDCIKVQDRGFQYGDGLFETIAIINGVAPMWECHMQRLQKSCERLQLDFPGNELLLQEVQKLTDKQNKCVIKIIVTRGSGGRGYRYPETESLTRVISLHPWPDYPATNWQNGVRVTECKTRLAQQPVLAGLKHLNRLEQVIARNEWTEKDIAEGIMFDSNNNLVEGTYSNIFLIKNNQLYTPDLSACGVSGVMREYIINLAEELEINLNICQLSKEDLMSADELFICNSLIGIWPVKQVNNSSFSIGPLTKQLLEKIQQLYMSNV